MSQQQQITLSISSLTALAVIALFLACVHQADGPVAGSKPATSPAAPTPTPTGKQVTQTTTASATTSASTSATTTSADAPSTAATLSDAPPVASFIRITAPLFPESPERVLVSKTTWALSAPSTDADRLGLVSGNAAIRIKSHVVNDECATPWIEVAPRGFICTPVGPILPGSRAAKRLARKKAKKAKRKKATLIGSYAIAGKGARFYKNLKAAETGGRSRPARGDMLRRGKTVKLADGRVFWKTQRGEYIESTSVRRLWGSKYKGVEIDCGDCKDVTLAFAVNRRGVGGKVTVRRSASGRARVAKRMRPRQLVTVLELSDDNEFGRIGPDQWVARADLREIELQAPPAEVDVDGVLSRWADVDLDTQVAVLYDGRKPVFATLISSGRKKDRTFTGVFRVTRKKRRTTMASDRSRRQTYSAAVPYATYFYEGIAFHTAYWHNSFGKARSHGCVNLSPSDARTVYEFLGPEIPEGWSVVYGHDSQRGSVVSVRSTIPNPIPDPVVAAK